MWVVERWEKGKTEPSSRMDYPTFEEAKDGAHIRCLGDSIAIHREEPGSVLEEMADRVEVQHIHNFDKDRVEINWVNLRPWMMAISKRVDQISKGED
tara:strand:- start:2578 stop:2868 length:291 start_codon:yes stop_codon:yes gene_type:complete